MMKNISQHLFSFSCGLVAGLVPNTKSNIHPVLLGIIFAVLFTKIVFGDWDKGYQWSSMDPLFLVVVGAEGAIGAYISSQWQAT